MTHVRQIALLGRGFSGRVVKLRQLGAVERDELLEMVAAEMKGSDNAMAYSNLATRRCIFKMIVAVSKEKGLTREDVFGGEKAKPKELTWLQPGTMDLMGAGNAAWKYEALFTAKDDALLAREYRADHEVSEAEVEDIMGKAVTIEVDSA